jgi:metal-responsive CopG/Arc/MetJ family transcriptional regulator
MNMAKVAITIDVNLLKQVDRLVKKSVFPSRSRAFQEAVADKLSRLEHGRLSRECAKLNKLEEQSLADMGLSAEVKQWPEY